MTPIEYTKEIIKYLETNYESESNKSKLNEIINQVKNYYTRNIAPEMAAILIAHFLNLKNKQ